MFWEREPFTWNKDYGRITRFVSLGAFGGPSDPTAGKKQRVWLFSVQCLVAAVLIFTV